MMKKKEEVAHWAAVNPSASTSTKKTKTNETQQEEEEEDDDETEQQPKKRTKKQTKVLKLARDGEKRWNAKRSKKSQATAPNPKKSALRSTRRRVPMSETDENFD